jgi:hypothetical protein
MRRRLQRAQSQPDPSILKEVERERCFAESFKNLPPNSLLARQLLKHIHEAEWELKSLSLQDAAFLEECQSYLDSLRSNIAAFLPEMRDVALDLPSWPSLAHLQSLLDKINALASELPSSSMLPSPPSISLESLRAYLQNSDTISKGMMRMKAVRRNTFSSVLSKGLEEGERLFDELKDAVKSEGEKIAGILSHEAELFTNALKAGSSRLLRACSHFGRIL